MNVDLDTIWQMPLLTSEDYTSPQYDSDFSSDIYAGIPGTGDLPYDIYQTVRTCGTVIEATVPVLPRAVAGSSQIQVGIDELVAKATKSSVCTPGEAKWSVDNYGRAYTHGVRRLR